MCAYLSVAVSGVFSMGQAARETRPDQMLLPSSGSILFDPKHIFLDKWKERLFSIATARHAIYRKYRHFQGTRGLVSVGSGNKEATVKASRLGLRVRQRGFLVQTVAASTTCLEFPQDTLERSPLYGGGGLCQKRAWDYGTMLLLSPAPAEGIGRLCSSAGGVLLSP